MEKITGNPAAARANLFLRQVFDGRPLRRKLGRRAGDRASGRCWISCQPPQRQGRRGNGSDGTRTNGPGGSGFGHLASRPGVRSHAKASSKLLVSPIWGIYAIYLRKMVKKWVVRRFGKGKRCQKATVDSHPIQQKSSKLVAGGACSMSSAG